MRFGTTLTRRYPRCFKLYLMCHPILLVPHQDVVEFLRMNSLRGNVLVNKDLLTHVLQQSKTVVERFKGSLTLGNA